MIPARWRALVVAVALAASVAACGLRTPVRPPEDTAPVIPGEVTAQQEGSETVVRWRRAERSADGLPLDDLVAFVVERRRAGEQAWQRAATIDVVDQEKIRRRKRYSWSDPEASAGAEYRVFAVNADGQEGPPAGPATTTEAHDPAGSPEPAAGTP